jgi:hypothetical protein
MSKTSIEQPLNVKGTAAFFSLSVKALHEAVRKGEFPGPDTVIGTRRYWKPSTLRKFLDGPFQPPRPARKPRTTTTAGV